jgi:hypothetical protein
MMFATMSCADMQTTQLDSDVSSVADTQLCFPPEPSNPTGDTIAAGAPWDDLTLAKAVRFSRYASAVHGCLPGKMRTEVAVRAVAHR